MGYAKEQAFRLNSLEDQWFNQLAAYAMVLEKLSNLATHVMQQGQFINR